MDEEELSARTRGVRPEGWTAVLPAPGEVRRRADVRARRRTLAAVACVPFAVVSVIVSVGWTGAAGSSSPEPAASASSSPVPVSCAAPATPAPDPSGTPSALPLLAEEQVLSLGDVSAGPAKGLWNDMTSAGGVVTERSEATAAAATAGRRVDYTRGAEPRWQVSETVLRYADDTAARRAVASSIADTACARTERDRALHYAYVVDERADATDLVILQKPYVARPMPDATEETSARATKFTDAAIDTLTIVLVRQGATVASLLFSQYRTRVLPVSVDTSLARRIAQAAAQRLVGEVPAAVDIPPDALPQVELPDWFAQPSDLGVGWQVSPDIDPSSTVLPVGAPEQWQAQSDDCRTTRTFRTISEGRSVVFTGPGRRAGLGNSLIGIMAQRMTPEDATAYVRLAQERVHHPCGGTPVVTADERLVNAPGLGDESVISGPSRSGIVPTAVSRVGDVVVRIWWNDSGYGDDALTREMMVPLVRAAVARAGSAP